MLRLGTLRYCRNAAAFGKVQSFDRKVALRIGLCMKGDVTLPGACFRQPRSRQGRIEAIEGRADAAQGMMRENSRGAGSILLLA